MAEQLPTYPEIDTDSNPFLAEQLFPTGDPEPEPEPDEEREEEPQPTPEELQAWRSNAAVVQRFNTDPDFARQVVLQRARELGLQVQAPPPFPQQPQAPPQAYIDTIRQSLPQELHFLSDPIAKATWTATQAQVAPLRQQQAQVESQQRQSTYDAMSRELSQEAPQWTNFENEMLEILGFLRGAVNGEGPMTHQKYGSALKLLYRLASGDASATANAGRRMQQALRAGTRTSSGGGTRASGPDLATMIQKAPNSQAKWGLAFRSALREHGVGNV